MCVRHVPPPHRVSRDPTFSPLSKVSLHDSPRDRRTLHAFPKDGLRVLPRGAQTGGAQTRGSQNYVNECGRLRDFGPERA